MNSSDYADYYALLYYDNNPQEPPDNTEDYGDTLDE